tara:strand:- start:8259 stop:8972 length:714 start_codon:yes stop_codon:yes gene_type:complete
MPRKIKSSLHDESSSQQRAARLRCVRAMTNKPRDHFKKHYGIARGTLQNWESDRHGGLTEKGAILILKAFRAENVGCDLAWLLHGVGEGPYFIKDAEADVRKDHPDVDLITKELLYFRQGNDNAIDFIVKDESMAPVYMPGDYVCGSRFYRDDIAKLENDIAIVQTLEHGTLLRMIKPGDQIGLYHLYSLNVHGVYSNQMSLNVEILSAAPVKWHRKVFQNLPQTRKHHDQAEALTG